MRPIFGKKFKLNTDVELNKLWIFDESVHYTNTFLAFHRFMQIVRLWARSGDWFVGFLKFC